MQIEHRQEQGIQIFVIDGTLAQSETKVVKDTIAPYVDDLKNTKIILNLDKVPFMDSSGVGIIVSWFNILKSRGGQLALSNLGMNLKEIMKTTRLDTILSIFETEKNALVQLKK